ncbi:hypothetical protein [Solicola sp. PLA-1-18]|uniref:hypothetical protein n=1 Tax=Solicola sp. PLA-1-18 TaxID=3380532 RepID=UPI003B7E25B2
MSQYHQDPAPRSRAGRVLHGIGGALRTFVLAAASVVDQRAHGNSIPPETRRAQRPQDYRP